MNRSVELAEAQAREFRPKLLAAVDESAASLQPWRHWKMAECSESTGTISAPFSFALAITGSGG